MGDGWEAPSLGSVCRYNYVNKLGRASLLSIVENVATWETGQIVCILIKLYRNNILGILERKNWYCIILSGFVLLCDAGFLIMKYGRRTKWRSEKFKCLTVQAAVSTASTAVQQILLLQEFHFNNCLSRVMSCDGWLRISSRLKMMLQLNLSCNQMFHLQLTSLHNLYLISHQLVFFSRTLKSFL